MTTNRNRIKHGRASYRYKGEFPSNKKALLTKVVVGEGITSEDLKRDTAWQK